MMPKMMMGMRVAVRPWSATTARRVLLRSLSTSLPEGWEAIRRRNGDVVYYNAALRKTVKELPGVPRVQTAEHAVESTRDVPAEAIDTKTETATAPMTEPTAEEEHELSVPIDFKKAMRIDGHDSQIVHIDLEPHQCLRAESGSMIYMTEGVEMETTTAGGFAAGLKRVVTGENFFVSRFKYTGESRGTVAVSTSFPSKILHLSLADFIGGELICQKGAFLCGSDTTRIEMYVTKNFSTGFFGGEGFVLQRLTGSGDVCLRASGALIERDLAPNEVLRISSGCLVAFEPTVGFDITRQAGVKNVLFSGEGLFLTTLTGPGKVYLQSLPYDRVVGEIARHIPGGTTILPVGGLGRASTEAGAEAGAEDGGSDAMNASAVGDGQAADEGSIYGAAEETPVEDMDIDGGDEDKSEGVVDFFTSIFGSRD
ncbi:hypothetical protein PINS_up014222 [Pythium insidiosum]|nr:hypothetical protein PINS_up014222 [Pythium insidiosum]